MSARKYDLVLYGATGYVGALALDYIVKQPYDLKYAVAGRTKSKLEALLAKIPQHERFDIVIASSDDEASLRSMAKSARCILSTVGPYSLYGELLFKICAEEGTHYTDLTGETPFQMKMYQQHHETAVKTGAIMLSAAGFDSLPADLNAALAVRALQKKAPSSEVGRVQAAYKVKGGVSGGTLASMSEFIKLPTSAKTEIAKNAYVLSPIKGEAKRKMQLVTDMVDGNYGSLWVMGATNERNVYRTWSVEIWFMSYVLPISLMELCAGASWKGKTRSPSMARNFNTRNTCLSNHIGQRSLCLPHSHSSLVLCISASYGRTS